jgi:hypothetical protein
VWLKHIGRRGSVGFETCETSTTDTSDTYNKDVLSLIEIFSSRKNISNIDIAYSIYIYSNNVNNPREDDHAAEQVLEQAAADNNGPAQEVDDGKDGTFASRYGVVMADLCGRSLVSRFAAAPGDTLTTVFESAVVLLEMHQLQADTDEWSE